MIARARLPIAALLLAACSTAPPEANRMQPDHAPTPFSAAEIRAGCPTGRVITLEVHSAGQPATHNVIEFVDTSEMGASIESRVLDGDGRTLHVNPSRASWEDLQRHASFPAERTTIGSAACTTPAGTFDCWTYELRMPLEDALVVQRYWFAKSLPGPPVRVVELRDGAVASSMVMTANR